MRLQVNTMVALYCMLECSRDPARHVSAAELARGYGVSAHHLAKVLSELQRAGLVESVRGAGGGYRFAGNARRLTLMDVVSLFEKVDSPAVARTAVGLALGSVLEEIDENAKAKVGSITLATMHRLIARRAAARDRR
jgi:Rrf2 family protein